MKIYSLFTLLDTIEKERYDEIDETSLIGLIGLTSGDKTFLGWEIIRTVDRRVLPSDGILNPACNYDDYLLVLVGGEGNIDLTSGEFCLLN